MIDSNLLQHDTKPLLNTVSISHMEVRTGKVISTHTPEW